MFAYQTWRAAKARYDHGERIYYSCKPGFIMVGIPMRKCVMGQWSPLKFRCSGKYTPGWGGEGVVFDSYPGLAMSSSVASCEARWLWWWSFYSPLSVRPRISTACSFFRQSGQQLTIWRGQQWLFPRSVLISVDFCKRLCKDLSDTQGGRLTGLGRLQSSRQGNPLGCTCPPCGRHYRAISDVFELVGKTCLRGVCLLQNVHIGYAILPGDARYMWEAAQVEAVAWDVFLVGHALSKSRFPLSKVFPYDSVIFLCSAGPQAWCKIACD